MLIVQAKFIYDLLLWVSRYIVRHQLLWLNKGQQIEVGEVSTYERTQYYLVYNIIRAIKMSQAKPSSKSLALHQTAMLPDIQLPKHLISYQDSIELPLRLKQILTDSKVESAQKGRKYVSHENPCVVPKYIGKYKRIVLVQDSGGSRTSKLSNRLKSSKIQKQLKLVHTGNHSHLASLQKAYNLQNPKDKSVPLPKSKRKRERNQLSKEDSSLPRPFFFSVQKITLGEGVTKRLQNPSNSNSSCIGCQQKVIKLHPNSQLIKQINIVKQKLNAQRIVTLNSQLYANSNDFHTFFKIQQYNQASSLKGGHTYRTEQSHVQKKIHEPISIVFGGNANLGNLSERYETKQIVMKEKSLKKQTKTISKVYHKKFKIPFQTYYYRDLIWKANYSNSLYIETPLQYDHRLKVCVGKGNNSSMVIGLISRRSWLAFTDKPQQANFLWTQLKNLSFFHLQNKNMSSPIIQDTSNNYQPNSILTTIDKSDISKYMTTFQNTQQRSDERLSFRAKAFNYSKIIKSDEIKLQKVHNHLINNFIIGNKKALFSTMSNYYTSIDKQVFTYLPLTFHIKQGLQDPRYFQFIKYYHQRARQISKQRQQKKSKQHNVWIVKPGQNSNRGNGIKVCLSLQEIKAIIKKKQVYPDGSIRTYIVQSYIQFPLLYCKRKFDLRHYMMITSINGHLKGYWYKQGYVRTTSSQYSLKTGDSCIHLTNDAVQKYLPEYGKYQKGNKLSYDELNNYIVKHHSRHNKSFYEHIYPIMKNIGTDAIRACSGAIDPQKLQNNFEVFGLDFMIDSNLNVWLIEINTNPCLQLSCPLLASLIPKMVQNTLQLTLDAIFPPPARYCPKGVHYQKNLEKQNKYQLVFDERIDKLSTFSLEVIDKKLMEEEQDVFQDCGEDWEDD